MSDNIFFLARDEFLRSLQPRERQLFSTCATPEQLLADVQNFNVISANRQRSHGLLAKIKGLCDNLRPYFDVVGIVVQCNPEYAGVAWGAIRLVLQLASNFVTFFEKLAVTLERISQKLPQYEELAKLFSDDKRQPSQRLKVSLCNVYADLFRFFQSVVRIFTKKDCTKKKTPLVLTSLFWKPFDSRFEDILNELEFHDKLVKDEIQITICHAARAAWEVKDAESERGVEEWKRENANRTRDAKKLAQIIERRALDLKEQLVSDNVARKAEVRLLRLEAERKLTQIQTTTDEFKTGLENKIKDDLFYRVKQWLRPPELASDLEKALDLREGNTAEWLFDDLKFQQWVTRSVGTPLLSSDNFHHRLLWVNGHPGFGKTVLAASTIQHLRSFVDSCVLYFFFRHDSTTLNSEDASYRALLAQVLHSHRRDFDMIDRFAFAMNNTSNAGLTASRQDLVDLLRVCLQNLALEHCFLVLDGLDECINSQNVVRVLQNLAHDTDTKAIVFSRPNVIELESVVQQAMHLSIGRSTSRDISIFLSRNLENMIEDKLLPTTVSLEQIASRLAYGADGMFLWARLMMNYLSSPALSPVQRLECIESITMPEGLEAMYTRIITLICLGKRTEQRLAKWIIQWITFAARSVTSIELKEAWRVMDFKTRDSTDYLPNFDQVVLAVCASLVEQSKITDPVSGLVVTEFRFIHLSAREFFSNVACSTPGFEISMLASQIDISRSCLQYLTYCVPAQPLGGRVGCRATSVEIHDAFPLCNYAALNWIYHIGKAAPTLDSYIGWKRVDYKALFDAASQFLAQKFVLMAWIEASYLFTTPPKHEILRNWCSWASSASKTLPAFDWAQEPVLEDARELSVYLAKLHQDWGHTLAKSPECIWAEVTAFTPSRLLAQTSTTHVASLATGGSPGEQSSAQCLCNISEITPDGLKIGVLSIWPSRQYQDVMSISTYFPSEEKLYECSSGWIAQYEIWNLEGNKTVRTTDLRISLDTGEVWRQIQQSFWKGERSSQMQFPISIARNTAVFCVLRTIYEFQSSPRFIRKFSDGLCCTPILLDFNDSIRHQWPETPPHPNESFQRRWGTVTKTFHGTGMPIEWSKLSDIYRYWIKPNFDGNTIFFIDHAARHPTNISIFRYKGYRAGARSRISLIAATSMNDTESEHFEDVKVAFHPRESLLTFNIARRVFLWAFQHSDVNVSQLLFEHYRSSKVLKSLGFSECGKFVVVGLTDSDNHVILPIPERMLEPVPKAHAQAHGPRPVGGFQCNSPANREIQIENHRLPSSVARSVDQGSPIVSTEGGGVSKVSLKHTADSVSVQLSGTRPGQENEHIQITNLPRWKELSNANAWVQLPGASDEVVKVVLNKATQPWSSFSKSAADSEAERLPLVISRDKGSLKRTSRRISAGSEGLLGLSTTSESMDEEEFETSKKIRYL